MWFPYKLITMYMYMIIFWSWDVLETRLKTVSISICLTIKTKVCHGILITKLKNDSISKFQQ